MDLPDKAVELITCPTCHAEPGQPCRTISGRKLTDNGHTCHSGRVDPVREIWGDGYGDAEELTAQWRDRARRAEEALTTLRGRIILLANEGQGR